MNFEIIERNPRFNQVCVWPGTLVLNDQDGQISDTDRIKEFEEFMLETFKTRVQYLEEVKTNPDISDGVPVPDTGNRNDLIFAVHEEDISHFAIPRLEYGIRWIEDVLDYYNHSRHLYNCEKLDKYKIW